MSIGENSPFCRDSIEVWGVNNLVDCVFTLELTVGACVPSPVIGEQKDNIGPFFLFCHIDFSPV